MGKPKPEKQPDYTQDRAAFATSMAADRQRQADTYNSSVSDYNKRLNSYLGSYNDLSSQIGNLSIIDDEKFGGFQNTLNDLQRQLTGTSFTTEKPFFESMVQSPYGAVQVSVPQLSGINTSAQSSLSSGLSSLSSKLQQLQDARKAEEARISNFNTGLLSQIGSIGSTLSTAGIGNKSVLDTIKSQLDGLDTQRSTFSSDILNEVFPSGFGQVQQQEALARAALQDLYGKRTAEEGRINSFNTGLQNTFDNFRDQFGGLTIADESGINSLQKAIDDAQIGAGRFSSALGYDFSPTLSGIQGIEDQLGGLRNQRQSELARIQQAQAQGRSALSTLDTQMGGADIYNLSSLKALQAAIDGAQADIGSFTSQLPFDFSEFSDRLTGDEATLQQLMDRRNTQLGGFQSQLDSLLGGVNSTDLSNEDAFKKAIADLQGLQSSTGRFSGNDVTGLNFGVQDAIKAAQGKLTELGDYRNAFEGRAQDFLDQVNGQSFYNESDFADPLAQLAAMQAEMEKYKATQGADELAGIKGRLESEQSRLAQDLLNSSNNSAISQSDVARMLAEQNATGPMTVEQYIAFLNSLNDEEQNPANAGNDNFSRNIGVIRL